MRINVVTSIFNVSVVCLLNVLFWSPNENKLTLLFVRASVKDLRFQPRGVFKLFSLGKHVRLFGFEPELPNNRYFSEVGMWPEKV